MKGNKKIESSSNAPSVGVVIGSGGLKSFASLELFKFLQENGIQIDFTVSCSGGSITAASYGMGIAPDEIQSNLRRVLNPDLFNTLDYQTLLGILNMPFGAFNETKALLDPNLLIDQYRKWFGDARLEELGLPTYIQSTDIHTGEGVILDHGLVAEAVYVSTAILPFFPPRYFNGRLLGDGAFSSPVPIKEALKRGADIIIAIDFPDVSTAPAGNYLENCNNFLKKVFSNTVTMDYATSISFHHFELIFIDVVFEENIEIWEVGALDKIFDVGRKAVKKSTKEILSVIESYKQFIG